jgi:hypothetical protein
MSFSHNNYLISFIFNGIINNFEIFNNFDIFEFEIRLNDDYFF